MRKLLLMLTIAGASLVVPTQANIVQNGDFDANTPAGGTAPLDWTFTPAASGSDFLSVPGRFGAHSLTPPNSANFGAIGVFDDTLSQSLPTVTGATYTLTYELAHADTDSANDFSASWNGAVIPGSALVNTAEFGYTLYTFCGLVATRL
jgi:hypothetical protein